MDQTPTSTLRLIERLQNVGKSYYNYYVIDRLAAIKRKGSWQEGQSSRKRFKVVLGLDNRNINNRYRYSTFSDNRYRDQISICTYAHAHSVQGC